MNEISSKPSTPMIVDAGNYPISAVARDLAISSTGRNLLIRTDAFNAAWTSLPAEPMAKLFRKHTTIADKTGMLNGEPVVAGQIVETWKEVPPYDGIDGSIGVKHDIHIASRRSSSFSQAVSRIDRSGTSFNIDLSTLEKRILGMVVTFTARDLVPPEPLPGYQRSTPFNAFPDLSPKAATEDEEAVAGWTVSYGENLGGGFSVRRDPIPIQESSSSATIVKKHWTNRGGDL